MSSPTCSFAQSWNYDIDPVTGLARASFPGSVSAGPRANVSYPSSSFKQEGGGVYVFQPNPSGPNGLGIPLSVVVGAADGAIVPGGAPWGPNGDPASALATMAAYGGLDSVGEYIGNFSHNVAQTVAGVTCKRSPSFPSNPCTRLFPPAGTTFPASGMYMDEGIFTNTTPRYGSLIAAWEPGGAWIDVPGWTQINYPAANPVPNLTNYDPGTGFGVYIGVWTGHFGLNIQLVNSAVAGAQPWGGPWANEIDAQNSVAYNPVTDLPHMDGLDIIGTGSAQFSHGLRIGGLVGLTDAPWIAAQIDNFGSTGLAINQAGVAGGIGISFIMQGGIPINVNNGLGNSWQVDYNGNQSFQGNLIETSGQAQIGSVNAGPTFATRFYGTAGLSVVQNGSNGGNEVDLISPNGFQCFRVNTGTAQLQSTTPYCSINNAGDMIITGKFKDALFAGAAGLPATCSVGEQGFALTGRNSGEGAGAGTGVPVYCDSTGTVWRAAWSSAAVTF